MQMVDADLHARVALTVDLLHRRGYALPPGQLSRLLHGGPATPDQVLKAARALGLAIDQGVVNRPGLDVRAAIERQRRHPTDAQPYEAILGSYVARLVQTCPWIDSVLLAGSMASGGFVEEDDIDLNLLVQDGTKHITYVSALALSLPAAWRNRRRAGKADTPFIRKLVCLNLLLERRQTRPLARQDVDLAFELALSRPLFGTAAWRAMLLANPGIVAHFPQMVPHPAPRPPPPRGGLLAAIVRRPALRRLLDGTCYRITIALHAWVKWHRRKDPEAKAHATRMEDLKRPYSSLERP